MILAIKGSKTVHTTAIISNTITTEILNWAAFDTGILLLFFMIARHYNLKFSFGPSSPPRPLSSFLPTLHGKNRQDPKKRSKFEISYVDYTEWKEKGGHIKAADTVVHVMELNMIAAEIIANNKLKEIDENKETNHYSPSENDKEKEKEKGEETEIVVGGGE